MRLLSSAVIGCAADIAITAFNTGGLNIAFRRAGLSQFDPDSKSGKSALVAQILTPALRAAGEGNVASKDALAEFVRLVAERVAPKSPDGELVPGTPSGGCEKRRGPTDSTCGPSSPLRLPQDRSVCACCRRQSRRYR